MDTLLYDISIPAISSLQDKLVSYADWMRLISVVFDPKYAFLIYSPIAYLLDRRVGRRLILTTVIAEWLNQILKWLLHGERPYWYVHSSGRFDPQQVPIKQFPITCELGPGHPSGHAMVTAAVWFTILDSALQLYTKYQRDKSQGQTQTLDMVPIAISHRQAKASAWLVYLALLVTVSISRVFLGCHFPHQCLAGALLGLVVAKYVASLNTRSGSLFLAVAPALFLTAFGTFGLLQALGFDPSWTIKLATKHCVKREYIHLDTAPFFSIMRYCGFALGTGLGLLLPVKKYTDQLVLSTLIPGARPTEGTPLVSSDVPISKAVKLSSPQSSRYISWLSVKILTALLMARLVDNLGLFVSHANLLIFYSSALFSYTLFAFAFVNL